MKISKSFYVVCFLCCVSITAVAQLDGAVSFNAQVVEPVKTKEVIVAKTDEKIKEAKTEDKKLQLPVFNKEESLKKIVHGSAVASNPRFVKIAYNSFVKMQAETDKEHEKELAGKTFATPADREKALDELKKNEPIHFEVYEGEEKANFNELLNKDPENAFIDMLKRVSYPQVENGNTALQDKMKKDVFQKMGMDQGLSIEEGIKLSRKKMLEGIDDLSSKEIVPKKEEKKVQKTQQKSIQKIDEQTAIINPVGIAR